MIPDCTAPILISRTQNWVFRLSRTVNLCITICPAGHVYTSVESEAKFTWCPAATNRLARNCPNFPKPMIAICRAFCCFRDLLILCSKSYGCAASRAITLNPVRQKCAQISRVIKAIRSLVYLHFSLCLLKGLRICVAHLSEYRQLAPSRAQLHMLSISCESSLSQCCSSSGCYRNWVVTIKVDTHRMIPCSDSVMSVAASIAPQLCLKHLDKVGY